MEIRLKKHGPNSLATKVFFSDESGFEVASINCYRKVTNRNEFSGGKAGVTS
jgi:hypothetical protein